MIEKMFNKRCVGLVLASIFSGGAYCASITIDNDVIAQFKITQQDLEASNGEWRDGDYLPYAENGSDYSIAIKGLHSKVFENPNTNCNYRIKLQHLDRLPFAVLASDNEQCPADGTIVYSDAAKYVANLPHIRVGGFAYTDKDTITIEVLDVWRGVSTSLAVQDNVAITTGLAGSDSLSRFEIDVVNPELNQIRLKMRHDSGNKAGRYIERAYNEFLNKPYLGLTASIEPTDESIFTVDWISDELAAERDNLYTSGIVLTADNDLTLDVDFIGDDDSPIVTLNESYHKVIRFWDVNSLGGVANVPEASNKDKDPASLQLAQKAEVADFELFHAPLKERDYPENLTFRINEKPELEQTKNHFNYATGIFLGMSPEDVRAKLDEVKHMSKVIGANYLYPMKAVITVENKNGEQFQIYDQHYMESNDWGQLRRLAVAATNSRHPGSVTDLSTMVLPTYIDKKQLTYIGDTRCKTTGNVSYIKQSDSCISYADGFSDIQSNELTPRFIAAKLTERVTEDKVQKFSHKQMVQAASAVYEEALNYLFSNSFLKSDLDPNLDAVGYLGYLATVGLTSADKQQFRTYLSHVFSDDELEAMRPAAKSFPGVHDLYLKEYVSGTNWFKEIESRHYFLPMGIYRPYLSTFAFGAFADMEKHADYTNSPYSLLPAYDAPLVIFGTMVAALQTIEKMEGREAARNFYAKNGHNYHKLYKASSLILNQYGQQWIPASDRPLRRESIIFHAAYEYAQRAYRAPNDVLQSFCSLDDTSKKAVLTEAEFADCGLVQLHQEERDIAELKKQEIARFMRVEKTQISGGWDEILLPLISGPLIDYVFTGSLFGEEFEGLLEEFATTEASEIELETTGSELATEEEAGAGEATAAEESASTELGEELSETRFSSYCPI
ncbi:MULTISPECIES: hypothetical protein [Pseudoalteromonas]|uniref:Uncharacterized protein n=1 Tax=Pseudoalteromonas amylolytica TaxID=1859457 RepID=A0A1S1MZJ9_9GAMM|nr:MULTISPECIES: hypothetical protein [Pseudoalteromonas]OHU90568.1 hypothetical protein BFC16_02890 [Pseudoalteromonas sp. JW3]OHU92811.1 hypothetical protein BET10_05005 [Pseudoalteromonas amylolytica]